MIHIPALPGTPNHHIPFDKILEHCVAEAQLLVNAGFEALLIENMHDVPYVKGKVGPEITACMTAIAFELKKQFDVPMGIQVLAAANKEALSVALAANLQFIRAEGFVFGHLGDEGYHDSCAAELLRFRKQIGADQIQVFTDIKKKHSSHSITQDISLEETANAAEFFLSDGLVVTGASTGKTANISDLSSLQDQTALPVLVGSGITSSNLSKYWPLADAFIVGSALKKGGFWKNELDANRVGQLMDEAKRLKQKELS